MATWSLAALGLSACAGGAVNLAVLPAGSGWWCFEGPGIGWCARTEAGCVERRTESETEWVRAGSNPSELPRCTVQKTAVCVTAESVMERRPVVECFPSVQTCKDAREWLATKRASDYRDISACAVVSDLTRASTSQSKGWYCASITITDPAPGGRIVNAGPCWVGEEACVRGKDELEAGLTSKGLKVMEAAPCFMVSQAWCAGEFCSRDEATCKQGLALATEATSCVATPPPP